MSRLPLVFALVVSLLTGPITATPVAAAGAPNAVTWTMTGPSTITAVGRIEIFPTCARCAGAVDEGFAARMKAKIEKVWQQARPTYKCADVVISVDIKVGTDGDHTDADRVPVAIDNSGVGIRSTTTVEDEQAGKWKSNDPKDRLVPIEARWAWAAVLLPASTSYAHEFGHILGLDDSYHDVWDQGSRKMVSVPFPDADIDVMALSEKPTIEQSTIDRLVERHSDLIDLGKLGGCSSQPPAPSRTPQSSGPATGLRGTISWHYEAHQISNPGQDTLIDIDMNLALRALEGTVSDGGRVELAGPGTFHAFYHATNPCGGGALDMWDGTGDGKIGGLDPGSNIVGLIGLDGHALSLPGFSGDMFPIPQTAVCPGEEASPRVFTLASVTQCAAIWGSYAYPPLTGITNGILGKAAVRDGVSGFSFDCSDTGGDSSVTIKVSVSGFLEGTN